MTDSMHTETPQTPRKSRWNLDIIAQTYSKDSAELILAKHFLSHRNTLPPYIIIEATPEYLTSRLNFRGSLAQPSNNLIENLPRYIYRP